MEQPYRQLFLKVSNFSNLYYWSKKLIDKTMTGASYLDTYLCTYDEKLSDLKFKGTAHLVSTGGSNP